MIKVFFDGKCGLCSKEISYYKKICDNDVFDWIDIARNGNALKKYNVSQSNALLYLHATLDDKELFVGVDAFLLIWKNLPRWKILALIVNLPLIKNLCTILYKYFAKKRFNGYSHCKLANTKI